jgi:hypothetical protein
MESQAAPKPQVSAPTESAAAADAQMVRAMQEREREIMQLIGCNAPERILHDLRNILNEVQLLRLLVQQDEKA